MTLFSRTHAPRRPCPASAHLAALVLIAGASLGHAGSASAQQFKVTASGKINQVTNPDNIFNASAAIGTPYTFSFLFDYAALNVSPTNTEGLYKIGGASAGATASFGDYQFAEGAASLNNIHVINNISASDRLDLNSAFGTVTGPGTQSLFFLGVELHMTDFTKLLISSNALPTLSDYNNASLNGQNGNYTFLAEGQYKSVNSVQGTVTSLKAELVNPVPEISTTLSLGLMLSLGGMAVLVRRQAGSRRSR